MSLSRDQLDKAIEFLSSLPSGSEQSSSRSGGGSLGVRPGREPGRSSQQTTLSLAAADVKKEKGRF